MLDFVVVLVVVVEPSSKRVPAMVAAFQHSIPTKQPTSPACFSSARMIEIEIAEARPGPIVTIAVVDCTHCENQNFIRAGSRDGQQGSL